MGIFNEYIGDMENTSTHQAGARGALGQKGDPGVGYHLTTDGNYGMKNKKIYFLDTPDDQS